MHIFTPSLAQHGSTGYVTRNGFDSICIKQISPQQRFLVSVEHCDCRKITLHTHNQRGCFGTAIQYTVYMYGRADTEAASLQSIKILQIEEMIQKSEPFFMYYCFNRNLTLFLPFWDTLDVPALSLRLFRRRNMILLHIYRCTIV